MSRLLILASYPKSGNTWLRIFLANLLLDRHEPADINTELAALIGSGADQGTFDAIVGVKSSDLTDDETDCYRHHVFRYLAAAHPAPSFVKVHDAYRLLAGGRSMFPPEVSPAAVYVVRNPLDVAVSLAHHLAEPFDRAVGNMSLPAWEFPRNVQTGLLRQRLSSWSEHVLSWVNQKDLPVHVARFEDMVADPAGTFTAAARFCGLPCDNLRVARSIGYSSFQELQKQEHERGFSEKPAAAKSFFREGRIGAWRENLSRSQIDHVIRDHETVMRRFGYLDDAI